MSLTQGSHEHELPVGLYEALIDRRLDALVAALPSDLSPLVRDLDVAESHIVLARHVANVLREHLQQVGGEDRVTSQVALCNRLLEALHVEDRKVQLSGRELEAAAQLLAVSANPNIVNINQRSPQHPQRPETPLSSSSLLTGTRVDPSLVSQLRKEIQTADQIDILCSFIKWSGIRVLDAELRAFTSRNQGLLRIITTSYMGATDPRAIDFLSNLPNTELQLSYDTKRTRLHAKAYIFHRNTGFGTAYVGSANLSHAAITDGLEWNVKISQVETPHLWDKATGTFESYCNDAEFEPYVETDRERFVAAINEERHIRGSDEPVFQFDIKPYGYQQEILDKLHVERTVHDCWKNLIVAATGTGKTVIAAFDYRSVKADHEKATSRRPLRLLFVAHREEILKQSLACFRAVLRNQNFGDLLVGGTKPSQLDALFVSIQTWNSRNLHNIFSPDYFDYVIVDEFHHAEAPSYNRLLGEIRPRILLGLTATPERSDRLDILHHFKGRVSAEIRLPDAINRKLLSPFQYFGITDSVDLSTLRWQRGGYLPAELEAHYTANDSRADLQSISKFRR